MKQRLIQAVEELMTEAESAFADIARLSSDGIGVTRESYGPKETETALCLKRLAERHQLAAQLNPVGNICIDLDGQDAHQRVVIGSHLDTVPVGGNLDGLAGVVAGIVVQAACKKAGVIPNHSLRTIGFRGEESAWFGTPYLGSKLELGLLSQEELDSLQRVDSGQSLASHLEELGCLHVAEQIKARAMQPTAIAAYLELHIEQGTLLEREKTALAVASALRGNIRHRAATCTGEWGHSGAVPRHLRSDAVIATARLIAAADEHWKRMVDAGADDLVFTCGMLQTDARLHSMTKVPGKTTFSLNIGSTSNRVMDQLHDAICREADRIATEQAVRFDFGPRLSTPGVALDEKCTALTMAAARELGHTRPLMPTVGHDTGMFAKLGVPTAMVLVRNQHGSHNPDEAMRIEDFCSATKVLALTAIAA